MLNFEIEEGRARNYFLRDGRVAAHLMLRSGAEPRMVVAFPAGNSGLAMWFGGELELSLEGEVASFEDDGHRGIEFTMCVGSRLLEATRWAAGGIRMLRLVNREAPVPPSFDALTTIENGTLKIHRKSLEEAQSYILEMSPVVGTVESTSDGGLTLSAKQPLRIVVRASSSEDLLTPLRMDELLTADAGTDQRSRDVLAFLSYQDKLCAGSWRFLTYFGRDTLLTLRLLMPILAPEVIEAGLTSVLEGLSPLGRVAHEEAVGEWALHQDGHSPSYDWGMIDDDFMLASVLAHYLLDDERGRQRSEQFLARKTRSGEPLRERVARNAEYVRAAASGFAERPEVASLIHIADEGQVGNWRDSQGGLAGGRIPWDVNVVLLPAALHALERLSGPCGLGDELARELRMMRQAWTAARSFFSRSVAPDELNTAVAKYCKANSLAQPTPLSSKMNLEALSLDPAGRAIPVMHSDLGYALIFDQPSAEVLENYVALLDMPFPQGLGTDIGIPVANPVLVTGLELSRDDYHGSVMWPWQHAMWILGLREQGQRESLPEPLRVALNRLAAKLARDIAAIPELRTAELWSWEARDGQMVAVPFGQSEDHRTESNAAQLWSTMDLILERVC